MAARLCWTEQNATGDGVAGLIIKLHRYADSAEIGSFMDDGGGVYHYDHNISERVIVKVGGVTRTGSSGMMFPADDVALATTLASTAAGAGASLIGIEDPSARFTGTTLEAILGEIRTMTELLSTGSGQGAAWIGSHDVGGYYTGANVEAILQEIGAITALLTGLTASAAELNKLDGASANVTAANLSTLTGGTASDAGSLHRHDMEDLLGNVLEGNGQTDMGLALKSQYTSQYGKGAVVLDVFDANGSGKAYVRTGDEDDQAALYEIATSWLVGDANFSGSPVIGSVANPGKITNAIKLLAAAAAQTISQIGMTRRELYAAGIIAGSANGNAAADPATVKLWGETSTAYVVKAWKPWHQVSTDRWLRCQLSARNEAGFATKGRVKFECATESMEIELSSETAAILSFYIELANLPVTWLMDRSWKISLVGVATTGASIFSDVTVWVEIWVTLWRPSPTRKRRRSR